MSGSIDVGLEVSTGLEHSLLKIFGKEMSDDITMLRLDSEVTHCSLFLRNVENLGYQFGAFTIPQLEGIKIRF